ncbi:hypothetical protein Tco_0164087 [Tanacetum coccineum]
MPFPRFTKVIVNHFLKQHKSFSNLKYQHYHTIKDDGIVCRLKFVRIGEDYQEYGLSIPETMLTEAIKQSESYQMFIKYSTSQIPPKKSRGKGSQRKKTADDSHETVDVSKESEPEPEPVKRKTSSKRRVKKKVTLSADDNIISDDPDTALELGKSISQTKAEEAEAARQVHATHARIVIESAKKKSGGRSSKSVVIQDTPSAPNSKPTTSKTKLKGAPSLTPEEQEATDIMQALKESKKTSKRQPGIEGSNEGTGTITGVPNESTVVSATSSEGTGTKLGVPDEEKDITEENKDDKDDDEGNDYVRDDQDADDEDAETESDEDDIYKYKIRVRKDEDEEMINAEVDDSDKGDEEVTDAAKACVEKTSEVKDDAKKTEFPPSSSSLSVSSGFGDQFLKLSSDSSLASTIKDTTDAEINSFLEVKIQFEVPHTQSSSILSVPVFVISKPIVLTPVQESPSKATVTTLPPLSISTTPLLKVAKLEKDMSELKKIDLSAEALAALKTQVPSVVDNYLGSKVRDVFQKELKKHTTDLIYKYSMQQILELPKKQTPTVDLEQESEKTPSEILMIKREQAKKLKMPKFTIKSINKAALHEYDLKSALYQTMHANKKHDDDDEDPPAGPNQGKAPSKGFKTGKSASTKEPVKEPIAEVVMDDAGDDVVRDDDQSQDASKPKTAKTPNPDWFKQPPRPPTHDPEWNKRQVILDQPEQPWFNEMVSAIKDPLTCNDLMATPIDFSKYVLNQLKIDNLTQDILLGPAYNLLKGTCSSSEEIVTPFDLSKPLPLQGHPSHQTVTAGYFFNNDLEYLKSSDPERTYTTSITKTKAARYEIEGIKDMVSTLWSPTKVGYDKDALKGIKHWGEGRKLWHRSQLNKYGHLEEIVVKRADCQLYKFKEGDFVDLHLNDIEDMLLLSVQHKLSHLTESDIVDFIMALHMFTRSLVIKKRVEDLQLGVESYQKKLNITLPKQTFPEIKFKELYTPSHKPLGVIYEDLTKQKRVMRADELYKFSDRTLKKVQDELHHRVRDFRLEYITEMPKRKWTAIDRKRSKLMVELIDKQMRERRIIRNLERLVGAWELEMDYKLMRRTV